MDAGAMVPARKEAAKSSARARMYGFMIRSILPPVFNETSSAYGDAENAARSCGGGCRAEGRPGTDSLESQSPRRIDRNGDLRVVADGGPRRADDLAGGAYLDRFTHLQIDGERLVLRPGGVNRHKERADEQHNARRNTAPSHVLPHRSLCIDALPVGIRRLHGPHLLQQADEAQGVLPAIFQQRLAPP